MGGGGGDGCGDDVDEDCHFKRNAKTIVKLVNILLCIVVFIFVSFLNTSCI